VFSLAGLRYRNVLAIHGGPIAQLDVTECAVFGQRQFQANARVRSDLIWKRRQLSLYSSADGSGTHASPLVARFMAISECLERWAYHTCVCSSDASRYGFDIDATSNGMAAFPGLTVNRARHSALLEAIERASLFDWWEGRCRGELITTRWPGVEAVRVPNPLGVGVMVITLMECAPGCYAYGHAAGDDLDSACSRSVVEMVRCGMVLSHHRMAVIAGRGAEPTDRFERRLMFFSSPEGHEEFRRRIADGQVVSPQPWRILCDREIKGPWSQYATVWRVLIRSVAPAFLEADDQYFFW
jgi:hypothetical protein